MKDPLSGTSWSTPGTVAGFAQSGPNARLVELAAQILPAAGGVVVDIGAGAGRNAVPMAAAGWRVLAVDLSWPMLQALRARAASEGVGARILPALAPMHSLPVASASADFAVAHGIWNLARSSDEFRAGVAEAARVCRPGAPLFVFTFSRHTLPEDAEPVAGETFVFTQFSGAPQCFVTGEELVGELARGGFERVLDEPLLEHNLPPGRRTDPTDSGQRTTDREPRRSSVPFVRGGPPVIWEGVFRRRR